MRTFLVSICLLISVSALAKRAAPPKVDPLVAGKTQYSFETKFTNCDNGEKSCGMRVFLVSSKLPSGKENWKTELYHIVYDPQMETDVQQKFPTSLKKEGNKILVTDESGNHFSVNAKNGKRIDPKDVLITQ